MVPLSHTDFKVLLLLLPCQDLSLFSNPLGSKGRSSSLCQKLCENYKNKCLPQAASRINRLGKQMLEGKRKAQLHKLTALLQDDLLPSRSEVPSQSKPCAKHLPTANPPTDPTPWMSECRGFSSGGIDMNKWVEERRNARICQRWKRSVYKKY